MESFFRLLKREPTKKVFNPWYDVDPVNDLDETAPAKRLSNLKAYLGERRTANHLLLAEAVGYQGGHFTGIPMTSERIILGHKADQGISPDQVCHHSFIEPATKGSIRMALMSLLLQ